MDLVVQATVVPEVVTLKSRAGPARDQTTVLPVVQAPEVSDDFCTWLLILTVRTDAILTSDKKDHPSIQLYCWKSILICLLSRIYDSTARC